jgi:hypothetical protein
MQLLPVKVPTVYNRRKEIVYLPPKILHPENESRSMVLKSNVFKFKQQEGEILITNYIYFSEISELTARVEVSSCRQFGTPDFEKR